MPNGLLDGLSLLDSTGIAILATTIACLALAIAANLYARARYAAIERDLDDNAGGRFTHAVLIAIAQRAREAAQRSDEPNVQAIVEDRFQADLRPLLLAERFVRAATGLVIILGLMGTFYGLTLSIGRLVHLVAGDPGAATDVAQAVTGGLTRALSGMAVAFSNSLLGIASAIVLTVLGVVSNLTDRRVALMLRIETWLDDALAKGPRRAGDRDRTDGFAESVERLDAVVSRFEGALAAFATSTRDFTEFNAHLKDNVQRMSLSFGDFSDTLKSEITALKRGNGR